MTLFKDKYRIESNRLRNWDYSSNGIYFLTFCTYNREHLFGKVENGKMALNENGIIVKHEIRKSIDLRDKWVFHNWIVMPNHVHILVEIKNAEIRKYNISERKISISQSADDFEKYFPFGFADYLNDSVEGLETHCSAPQQPNSENINIVETHCCAPQPHNIPIIETLCSAPRQQNSENINILETHCSALQQENFENINIVQTLGSTSHSKNTIASRKPKSISSFVAQLKSKVTKSINDLQQTKNLPIWQSNYHDHVVRNYDELLKIFWYIEHNPKKWEEDIYNL